VEFLFVACLWSLRLAAGGILVWYVRGLSEPVKDYKWGKCFYSVICNHVLILVMQYLDTLESKYVVTHHMNVLGIFGTLLIYDPFLPIKKKTIICAY